LRRDNHRASGALRQGQLMREEIFGAVC
jgi:hypothetical protein